jgi:hypothetical protein
MKAFFVLKSFLHGAILGGFIVLAIAIKRLNTVQNKK